MKAGWQRKILADTCDVFVDGNWIESKDQASNGIRLIQTGNVGKGVFKDRAEKARYISEATFRRLRCTEIFEGDCLISRLPDPVGRSCLIPAVGERMITAVDCTIVRFDTLQVIPEFFNYYSQSTEYLDLVDFKTTGTTRNRISRSNLGQILIPVPSLPEQQRIVRLLDTAFDGIATAQANAEKNLENARELFESELEAVFRQRGEGWLEVTLADVCQQITDGKHGDCENEIDSGYYFLSAKDVKDGRLNFEKARQITKADFADTHRRTNLETGDILITNSGTIGRIAIAPEDERTSRTTFQKSVAILKPIKTVIESRFAYFCLTSSLTRLENLSAGAAQKNLLLRDIRAYRFALPKTLEGQRIVAGKLDNLLVETQHLESIYQQKLDALDELKKSLLHQAFNGELGGL